ncbi:putative membrane protein [Tamilnaduibacter salinus]|uniref:Putative membrane protein n=1 Tax=Tamilnaduibacter salinus TaxID=1484056 RepID=A0A2U1CWF1_9GAMM|nr:CopD family protein [Tamilnaduibacter salinus]PVY76335.1 putative membrane protein [Tamilnaduibacter salinus]
MSLMIALHTLAAVIWVGGMFFAYVALRPAAVQVLEPEQRALLWCHTLSRFFRWVWASVAVLLVTGFGMIGMYYGGMDQVGWYVHVMLGLGIVMMLLFLHIWFAPYRRLKQAIEGQDTPEAGRRVGQIRLFVAINLTLGLAVVLIASGGRYLMIG